MPSAVESQTDCPLPAASPLQLSRFIDSAAEIAAEAQGLLRALRVPPEDMRGVGITVLFLLLVQSHRLSVAFAHSERVSSAGTCSECAGTSPCQRCCCALCR